MYTLLDAWQLYQATKFIKGTNLLKEISRFNLHLIPYWANTQLHTIKAKDILAYRKYLFDKNLSPQTVRLCMSQLRSIMKRAIQLEAYVGQVPYFEMPKINNKRIRYLTENEASTLLSALYIKSELWHDISIFALNTGMRANEIFSLRHEAINLNQNTLTIFEAKNSCMRIIPLNANSRHIAQKYTSLKLPFLFSNSKFSQVSKIFRSTVQELGINNTSIDRRDKIVFHSLRHTFASWLVQKGVPLMVISNLLGHKDLTMTMRYAHLAPEQGQHAVTLLPSNISPFMESRKK